MGDRVSRYRVVRLVVFPPRADGDRASYTVCAETIKNGVPRAKMLASGYLPNAPAFPSAQECAALFDSALTDWEARD